jgi:hypothetical protein
MGNMNTMSKKLTIEEINLKLTDRGITVIGEYKSNATPVKVQCSQGHIWEPRIGNLISRKDGCPHCSRHSSVFTWTTESINDKLKSRGITLISEYSGKVKDKGTFVCTNNHEWVTSVNSVLNGRGCKKCHGKTIPLTLEIIKERYSKFGYSVDGVYTGHGCNLTFTCSKGHVWKGNSGNTRCSSCAKYGFDINRKAYGYILQFDGFIKYGISNSIESRLYRHKIHNPKHEVLVKYEFDSGADAKNWENTIKTEFGGRYVDKTLCPDGWTETLPNDLIPQVIEKYVYFSCRKF